MKKGLWKDAEVQHLFHEVESAKQNGKSLKQAFLQHANAYQRRPNSVRNYYYHEIDTLLQDPARCNRLGIDLAQHAKAEIQYFSEKEESELLKKIEALVNQGMSVRKACLSLSNGDINKMLRYQNKYRNYISKKDVSLQPSNVIKFTTQKKDGLSDSDIQSLFMGLVRLVKRSAVEEFASKLKVERESANLLLRKTLVDLQKKDKEIQTLKDNFARVKAENAKLLQNMMKMRFDKAEKLTKKMTEKLPNGSV